MMISLALHKTFAKLINVMEKTQTENSDVDVVLSTIGDAYASGFGVAADEKQAIRFYRKAATMGNGHALCRMADYYLSGNVLTKDIDKAIELYEKAGDSGSIEAMVRLGDIYWNGENVEKNHFKACEYYLDAMRRVKEAGLEEEMPEVYTRIADGMMEGVLPGEIDYIYEIYCTSANTLRSRMSFDPSFDVRELERAEAGMDQCEKILKTKSDGKENHTFS